MSTNINISVGDNKLLDQARLQQNASRQAQLEKEANKRLEAQATDARTKANANQGLDTNGNLLTGVTTPAPIIDRRPAANRQASGLGLLFIPDQTYNTQYTIPATSKTKTYAQFTDLSLFNNAEYLPSQQFNVSVQGGPQTSGALTSAEKQVQPFSNNNTYGYLATASNGPPFGVGVNRVAGESPTDQVDYLILKNQQGAIVIAETKIKAKDIDSITTECLLKIGASPDGVGSENNSTTISVQTTIYDQGSALNSFPVAKTVYFQNQLEWSSLNNGTGTGTANYTGVCIATNGYSSASTGNIRSAPGRPNVSFNEWVHFAWVKTKTEVRFYLKGQLISSFVFGNFPTTLNGQQSNLTNGTSDYISPIIQVYIDFYSAVSNQPASGPFGYVPCAAHGIRITNKALYTGNFIPPATITTLA